MHGQTNTPCRFRNKCTLLEGFINSINTVVDHRQQKATGYKDLKNILDN